MKIKKNKKVILTYKGEDFWTRPVYEVNHTGTYVKDIALKPPGESPSLYWSSPKHDIEGEPDVPLRLKEGAEIIFEELPYKMAPMEPKNINAMKILEKWNLNGEPSFRYQMLYRLKMDCSNFLNNRNPKVLWAKNKEEQIEIMKNLYNSFPDQDKPDWITMQDIKNYEKWIVDYDKHKFVIAKMIAANEYKEEVNSKEWLDLASGINNIKLTQAILNDLKENPLELKFNSLEGWVLDTQDNIKEQTEQEDLEM